MSKSLWAIDEQQIVHFHLCPVTAAAAVTPYFPARPVLVGGTWVTEQPQTALELLAHIDTPDQKDRHQERSMLTACVQCVGSMAAHEEGVVA